MLRFEILKQQAVYNLWLQESRLQRNIVSLDKWLKFYNVQNLTIKHKSHDNSKSIYNASLFCIFF